MIRTGEVIAMSNGEWSDYSIAMFGRVLRDFDENSVLDEYLAENEKQKQEYSFNDSHFINWLIGRELLEEIRYREWHYSDYSTPTREMATEP
jgi:hypothetical protein